MSRPIFTFTTIVEATEAAEDIEVGDEIECAFSLPGENVLCPQCRGTGTMVNPSIDGNGLSRSDFDEDPDFEEAYFRGDYDQACDCCHGNKVIVQIDESSRGNPRYKEAWEAYEHYLEDLRDEAIQRSEDRYTRRMESGGGDW